MEKASRVGGGDIRKRQLGAIAAILGDSRPSKRKKPEDDSKGGQTAGTLRRGRGSFTSEIEPPKGKTRPERREGGSTKEERDQERQGKIHRTHKRHRSVTSDQDEDRDGHKRRYRSRSRSPREHQSKEYRSRHRSPDRRRSRSPERDRKRARDAGRLSRSPRRRKPVGDDEKAVKAPKAKLDYDSDPLDDIIGPRPPPVEKVRTRGRGPISHASGIDSRFSSNYDPTVDVQLNPDEENDWDQALEALRDRQKWKQQGADRLKAAGFTEEEVRKWEKGGEKTEEDVKWTKQGESREWDRGKVFDTDGGISIEPKFGRLKDT